MGKFWQVFFWVVNLSRDFFGGIQNNRKIRAVPAYPGRLLSLEIFGLGNSAWDFWGVTFWSRNILGFRLKL